MQPTVAVIPAAGRGTRMRPATRVVPKAFLPLTDKPTIQHAVEEAVAAGVSEVIAVVDPDAIDLVVGHFGEPLPGLEEVTVTAVAQPMPLGLGDAVAVAAVAVGDRPFMCLLVDELVRPGCDVFGPLVAAAGDGSAVAVRAVEDESDLSRYGIVATGPEENGSFPMTGAVEKPAAGTAPSNLALVGRYVFQPAIFEALADAEPGHGGEIQLTDAIDAIAAGCRAVVTADLLDIGNPLGMAQARHLLAAGEEWGDAYRQFVADNG